MTCLSEDMFWLFSSGIVSIICLMILYLSLYWGVIHILYYSSIKMYNSMAFGTFTGLSNYHNSGLWKFRIFTSPQKENLYSLTVTLLSPVPQLLVHTCCCSISQLCLTLCDPINCGTPDSLSITISLSLLRLIPLSQWCHPTISSSVAPFSSCPQSFPASGSFSMSWLFTSDGQSFWELQLQHQSLEGLMLAHTSLLFLYGFAYSGYFI